MYQDDKENNSGSGSSSSGNSQSGSDSVPQRNTSEPQVRTGNQDGVIRK